MATSSNEHITDVNERRKAQNRVAQKNYRKPAVLHILTIKDIHLANSYRIQVHDKECG